MATKATKKTESKGDNNITIPVKKAGKAKRIMSVLSVLLLLLILILLCVNALLTLFKDNYYTTIGSYRLFAIVSDSMEPTIPTGSMIVDTKPVSRSEIKASTSRAAKDGTIITFRVKNGKDTILLTHRVVAIVDDGGDVYYTTRGDNAAGDDSYRTRFSDIVGIYTGNKCGFFGALFGFLQSPFGVSSLLFALFILIAACVMMWYINKYEEHKKLNLAALKRSSEALSGVNLRYDNIHEITAVMDVLNMITEEPKDAAERKAITARLLGFIKAQNFELPQTPETAAILDSLPAPDTPGSLAAALSSGATLRQAEDGQTLILTTLSGGKHILLTPINTADGIVLCQQGVRIRADIAPNIESLGATSIPTAPEFFEGQPLEKNIIYPELPQPSFALGPEALLNGAAAQRTARELSNSGTMSLPTPAALGTTEQNALRAPSDGRLALAAKSVTLQIPESYGKLDEPQQHNDKTAETAPSSAYARYRERAAIDEIKQAEKLAALLSGVAPLSADEQRKIDEYKAAHKKPTKKRTPEQLKRAKENAQRKKLETEKFLSSLSADEREVYLADQKLAKSLSIAIRRLNRMDADRKILQKLD